MKTILFKILFAITMVIGLTLTVHAQHLNRGMQIWQSVARGQSYTNVNDHITALKGNIFPGMDSSKMYGDKNSQPMVWKDYNLNIKAMAQVSLASMTSGFNALNMATGNSFTNEFGGAYVDESLAFAILGSSWISVGDMPAYVPGKGTKIKFDTYHQYAEGKTGGYMDSIVRERHWLGLVNAWEQALFVNIPGYEPIPFRSCFCGNNLSVADMLKFVKKKDVAPATTPVPAPKTEAPKQDTIFEDNYYTTIIDNNNESCNCPDDYGQTSSRTAMSTTSNATRSTSSSTRTTSTNSSTKKYSASTPAPKKETGPASSDYDF